MASDVFFSPTETSGTDFRGSHSGWVSRADRIAGLILRGLASLRLTVVLFAMGIFIILVGTLAQVEINMWQVIALYFRSWVATVPFQVFAPRTWFPNYQNIPYAFWFPGGATIGALMFVNLFAAHLMRFKSQATGGRLLAGLAVLLFGTAFTAYVVVSGHNTQGLQGQPPFSWSTLWTMMKIGLMLASAGAIYAAIMLRSKGKSRLAEQSFLGGSGVVLGLLGVWTLVAKENAYMGDAGMRILWQLIQATFCGLVLLAGCALVFRRRGGIVLIHSGVALMMFGQFYVSKYDVEEQMHLEEGETKSYAEDIRQTELAVIDSSDPDEDEVTIIPMSILFASHEAASSKWFNTAHDVVSRDGMIRDDRLPFDVQVVEYFPKAVVKEAGSSDTNPATAGIGLRFVAIAGKPASGTDSDSAVDLAAAYLRLRKRDGKDLGVYLVSQYLSESVSVEGKPYELALRFRRSYKPYQITLNDVRKDDYIGTAKPRNYSSDIRLVDNSRGVDRDEIHIWMNNPLRYAGETFYQSGYAGPPDVPVETTTLSVVTNTGWMIPYVACMIVIVGLCAHFVGKLARFLRRPDAVHSLLSMGKYSSSVGLIGLYLAWRHRRVEEAVEGSVPRKRKGKDAGGAKFEPYLEPITLGDAVRAAMPWIVVVPFAIAFAASMFPRGKEQGFDLVAFGKIPVIADGRVKPIDTLARNTLRVISNKESFRDSSGESQPAIRWLLDVIAQTDDAEEHRVLRIDNLEVLDTLGLKRRKGNLYSVAEIRPGVEKFNQQVAQAHEEAETRGREKLTVFQKKLVELDSRIRSYTRVAAAFQSPNLPELPSIDEFEKDRASFAQKLSDYRDMYQAFARGIDRIQPPLVVPPSKTESAMLPASEDWQAYSVALPPAMIEASLLRRNPPDTLRLLNEMFAAYAKGEPTKFNRAVEDYHDLLGRQRPEELTLANSFWNRMIPSLFGTFYSFESFFNRVAPFFFCRFPYLFAGVLAALSWLVWRQPLNRAAWWLTLFAFAIHTLALGARIYISGRPPVTNLYSSAIFIGWGAVAFCLAWEWFNRNGIAIFLSSLLGFSSLIIAHALAADGDTFIVLEAVLDTQFWLATHVVCITLGYATTFLAGAIGGLYILRGLLTRSLTSPASQEMARMVYGTTCFAMLFSFFGTVLGGLWADDSWGRFWGWDPKENGALIIVIWNALVLHARWGGMVRDRGLAVLAIGGNIVTSWSWFGVNELNVGLHSYGFTEGVLQTWGIFVLTQLLIIAAGCTPKELWRSQLKDSEPSDDMSTGISSA